MFQLAAQQVVYNSDFENWQPNGYPIGWSGAGATLPADSIVPYTSNPHSGATSCRLKCHRTTTTTVDTLYASTTINFQKGHKYSLNLWYKGKGLLKIYFGLFSMVVGSWDIPNIDWKKFNFTLIAQSDQINAKPYIAILKTDLTYDDIQIDDITISDEGLFQTTLDINNISATINANGELFGDLLGNPGFEVPKGSGHYSVFAGAYWIGGKDPIDSLHVAATRYSQIGSDFQNGPIAYDYSSANYYSKYHNIWKINKSDIDYHISHYNSPGYVIPEAIATWPGNGDVSNGESQMLAPFADLNGNGIYEPTQGEYPYIRGDQAIYYILNDDLNHTETNGRKLGIEQHVMLYAYNMPSDSALFNTIFATNKIVNRSDTNYHDVFIGFWCDVDLGDHSDDFIGCDSVNNFFVGFNGDEMDGNGSGKTYGEHPPAQAIAFLNYPMFSFMYSLNSSGNMSDPMYANEYYNLLTARWKDGTHLTYGGTGYGGTVPANYLFSGTYYGGWSEMSENNVPSDRRGVGSTGPFNLPAHSELCMEIAFPFARDYNGTAFSSAQLVRQRVLDVKTFFDNQQFDCMNTPYGVAPLSMDNTNISIFPNPSHGEYFVHQNNYRDVLTVNVYNSFGQCIYNQQARHNNWKIILKSSPQGIYFYTITDANGRILKNGKLIKE